MKAKILILNFVFISCFSFSQSSIPNGNFETWTTFSIDYPEGYPFNSNMETLFRFNLPSNLVKSTDAYHGISAVEITTVATTTDTIFGYFLNANPDNDPSQWTGGISYNQIPTGIRGYYKYNVATADSATIIVTFSKSGVNIGSYFFNIGGIQKDRKSVV